MKEFKPAKGMATLYVIFIALLSNVFIGALLYMVESYVIVTLMKAALVVLNVYFLYYIILSITLKYIVNEKVIEIRGFWGGKKVVIPIESIEGYDIRTGNIRGVKLSGIGSDKFGFGRIIIDKIGTTYMFVTSSMNAIYIKSSSMSYAISPKEFESFLEVLKSANIHKGIEEYKINKNIDLYKEKAFFIPFITATVIIIVLTLNPFVLYLRHMLPATMPLSFDSSFLPIVTGTGKQFAFKQMTYGVFNMLILLCMYYASYFCAKYDRKTAFKYIYVSLFTAVIFLILQIRILVTFWN